MSNIFPTPPVIKITQPHPVTQFQPQPLTQPTPNPKKPRNTNIPPRATPGDQKPKHTPSKYQNIYIILYIFLILLPFHNAKTQ